MEVIHGAVVSILPFLVCSIFVSLASPFSFPSFFSLLRMASVSVFVLCQLLLLYLLFLCFLGVAVSL